MKIDFEEGYGGETVKFNNTSFSGYNIYVDEAGKPTISLEKEKYGTEVVIDYEYPIEYYTGVIEGRKYTNEFHRLNMDFPDNYVIESINHGDIDSMDFQIVAFNDSETVGDISRITVNVTDIEGQTQLTDGDGKVLLTMKGATGSTNVQFLDALLESYKVNSDNEISWSSASFSKLGGKQCGFAKGETEIESRKVSLKIYSLMSKQQVITVISRYTTDTEASVLDQIIKGIVIE